MLGDSLTERAPWAEITGCPFIANRGISGDSTAAILSRLDDAMRLKPRAVFLMIGINDIHSKVPTAKIAENIKQIVEKLEATHTHIYLSYVLPVTKNYILKVNSTVEELNQAVAQLAQGPAITAIDLRPLMTDGEGNLRAELATDGLHLSAEGYRIWRDKIAPYVEANCTAPAVISQLR